MALAAAALTQWTGPRTVEYKGPGYFCGGGYAIRLTRGERALILPNYGVPDPDPAGGPGDQLVAALVLREPLELVKHIVRNDRPFTEIITADYIMESPYSARGYGNFEEIANQFSRFRKGLSGKW